MATQRAIKLEKLLRKYCQKLHELKQKSKNVKQRIDAYAKWIDAIPVDKMVDAMAFKRDLVAIIQEKSSLVKQFNKLTVVLMKMKQLMSKATVVSFRVIAKVPMNKTAARSGNVLIFDDLETHEYNLNILDTIIDNARTEVILFNFTNMQFVSIRNQLK